VHQFGITKKCLEDVCVLTCNSVNFRSNRKC